MKNKKQKLRQRENSRCKTRGHRRWGGDVLSLGRPRPIGSPHPWASHGWVAGRARMWCSWRASLVTGGWEIYAASERARRRAANRASELWVGLAGGIRLNRDWAVASRHHGVWGQAWVRKRSKTRLHVRPTLIVAKENLSGSSSKLKWLNPLNQHENVSSVSSILYPNRMQPKSLLSAHKS
jgi:hypothetical protein